MQILFFCIANIGDTLICSEILKQTCAQNPKLSFLLFTLSNSYLYENIPNLKILMTKNSYTKTINTHDNPNEFLDTSEYNELYTTLKENGNKPFFLLNESTVAINTWVGSYKEYLPVEQLECEVENIQSTLCKIYQDIQQYVTITYAPVSSFELLPKFTLTPLPSFETWYQENKSSDFIFYYNYLGRSGQCIINTAEEHNIIIVKLCLFFPNSKIVVPRVETSLQEIVDSFHIQNLIDCRKLFDIVETPSCKNLVDLAYIASKCKYIVQYDIGACYYFLNRDFLFKNEVNHFIYLSKRDFFIKKFANTMQLTKLPIYKFFHFFFSNGFSEAESYSIASINELMKSYKT